MFDDYRTPEARRLALILEDKGFTHDDGSLNLPLAARVINRRSLAPFELETLLAVLDGGREMSLKLARQLADGLRVDIRQLAYDDEEMPNPARMAENPLDELDII